MGPVQRWVGNRGAHDLSNPKGWRIRAHGIRDFHFCYRTPGHRRVSEGFLKGSLKGSLKGF